MSHEGQCVTQMRHQCVNGCTLMRIERQEEPDQRMSCEP